jgi:hypothetical protein
MGLARVNIIPLFVADAFTSLTQRTRIMFSKFAWIRDLFGGGAHGHRHSAAQLSALGGNA